MNFDFKRMIKFEHNVGDKEKKYRIYGGAALIAISIFTASIALLLIGMVLVATGFFGFCPINAGFNRNTCCTGDSSKTSDTPSEENN
jgi:Inner membrane protein YgaP-like, transmembrane domain